MIAGVDIGGTKTQLRASRGGRTFVDRVVATEDWRRRENGAEDAEALARIVVEVCGGAMPAALAVGAHGCDTDAQCASFQRLLRDATGSAVLVVNDSELMVPAAG